MERWGGLRSGQDVLWRPGSSLKTVGASERSWRDGGFGKILEGFPGGLGVKIRLPVQEASV